ncbi:MAG: 3-oxoacyl-ACP reductase FabG [Rhodococcus sp.]|uniref:SDR family NAD(P)-dependent oxidoreductase n=1 Tax=Rhodococcus sp. MEB032 TaxID=3040322 RepID=UPI00228BACE1|nr:3-oxoacyl-ACP reductase family protein [Rhodococcus sp. MEB032]MCY4670946.1 3-oxoacyl-ACP reductase FabG [Rhodococcus sp. (in: high G+C Gram-positive bacteria)]
MDLEGKVALVTGGSRGIGAAIAKELALHGADIALTYQRHAVGAAEVIAAVESAGRHAIAIAADAEDPDTMPAAVAQTVEHFGRVDVLVNNAAIFEVAPVEAFGVSDFDRTMAVNVRAPFLAAKSAAEQMGSGGRIITIGSNMIGRTVFPGFSLYSMSKTALVGLTKGLSRDLGARGITVNLVNPGPINTDMNPQDGPLSPTINAFTALGRYGQPEEIAAMVRFLASEEARYVTGAVLDVDGGFTV